MLRIPRTPKTKRPGAIAVKLFNVNAHVGSGRYAKPVFPELRDLLAHMDYLQVERALVWQTEARDFNPLHGNSLLLESLKNNPDLAERIIPALVVTPETLWQKGGIQQICTAFDAGLTKALRIFPNTNRFRLAYLDELLEHVSDYRPAIFTDIGEIQECDFHQVVEFAQKHPKANLVITQVMWGNQADVFYMMSKCKNIYLDISWLHVNYGIEKVIEHFGADRILFGLGFKSHNGAAIAALSHAQIDDATRELVSHQNTERILAIDAIGSEHTQQITPPLDKPLWQQFRNGQILDQVEIIDAHGHVGPSTGGWYSSETDEAESIEDAYQKLKRLGIDQMVISTFRACFTDPIRANMEFASLIRQRYHDAVKAYFVFNPHYRVELETRLDEFFSNDVFVGFKLLSDYWQVPVTDESYEPVWSYANAHRLIILLHTWNRPAPSLSMDRNFSTPSMLSDIVKQYPDAIFLLGHSGGGGEGRPQAVELAKNNSNVYLEFCGSFTSDISWESTIQEVGIDRVVFGSDATAHEQSWELGRFLSIPLEDKLLVPALAANFKRILALRS